jgi:hypothetical protein
MDKTVTVSVPKSIVGDLVKFDKAQFEAARNALASLIAVEAEEIKEGHNELMSISHLLEAVAHLHAWYEGEEAEGEVIEEETIIERAADAEDKAEVEAEKMCDKCEKSMKMCKCDKGAEPDPVPSAETYATLKDSVIVPPAETPKSAEVGNLEVADIEPEVKEEAPAVEETPAEEAPKVSADDISTAEVEAIVDQAIKSATASIKTEIASLVSAKEAALEKAVSLENELAIAKSLAVAGGPKRTGTSQAQPNDLLIKAATYKAKANATTDPILAKGYMELHKEFLAKANNSDKN